MSDEGRCSSCGFLSKFDRVYSGPPPNVYEMPPRDRSTGESTQIRLDSGREITTFPHCYLDVYDIWGTIDQTRRKTQNTEPLAAMEVFSADRGCPKWHRYTQGFSPQEHLGEIRMQKLELERQQFEQKMANDQNTFMTNLDSKNKTFQLILGLVLGGIALIEIFVGALQVVYPAGWPWLQKIVGSLPSPPPSMPGL